MLMLDHILNKKLGKPFIKMPPDDSLAVLSPAEVVSHLTSFTVRKRSSLTDSRSINQDWTPTTQLSDSWLKSP